MLSLLAFLPQLLLHLLLELLRLALQHFLLPLLLGSLRAIALLLRETLLALGQFVELLERIVDFLGLLLGGRRGSFLRLVLIFLGIELEIEQRGQIARRAASAASTPASASERDLNLPERGFRAQQILQGLLLVGNRIFPLLLLQLLRGRRHGLRRRDHVLLKVADGLHFIGQLARLQSPRKRGRLIAQRGLRLRQQLGDGVGLLLGRVLVALLFEGGRDDFFLALRDLRRVIALPSSAASTTAAARLRLRKFALERVGLNEHHVGVRFRVGVLGRGVDADQIARQQFEILQRQSGRSAGFLLALLRKQIHRLLRASVDRIMQLHAAEPVIAAGLGGNGDLFNRVGVIVAAAGPHQRNLRRIRLARLNEKILADPNRLAAVYTSDVISPVLIHLDGSAIDIIFAAH